MGLSMILVTGHRWAMVSWVRGQFSMVSWPSHLVHVLVQEEEVAGGPVAGAAHQEALDGDIEGKGHSHCRDHIE